MPAERRGTAWSAGPFFVDVRISMIHADPRREALERWLARELGGDRFTLTPASEDASFRRYFRATLDDGSSLIAMDAPPDKEDCRPFVHVARLLARGRACMRRRCRAQDLAQGFLLLTDLGTRTYLASSTPGNAPQLFADATDALIRWQLATPAGRAAALRRSAAAPRAGALSRLVRGAPSRRRSCTAEQTRPARERVRAAGRRARSRSRRCTCTATTCRAT